MTIEDICIGVLSGICMLGLYFLTICVLGMDL